MEHITLEIIGYIIIGVAAFVVCVVAGEKLIADDWRVVHDARDWFVDRYFTIPTEEVSRVTDGDDGEIMSNADNAAPSEASRPRTDAPPDGRTEPQTPTPQPVTLDTAKSLRAHGYTRDEARALLKTLNHTLGNDTWAAAKPADLAPDDTIVTPYAGRVTKRSYYPEAPELEYQECKE